MVEEYDSYNLKNQFTLKVTYNNMEDIYWISSIQYSGITVLMNMEEV